MTWQHRAFEQMDNFFDKIWAWEHLFFLRIDVFLQNKDMRAGICSWKIGTKGTLLTFLAFDGMTFFWLNMGMTAAGVFQWKIWNKKWYGSTAFCRESTFFGQNMGIIAVCFLDNERSFLTKYGRESRYFFVKNQKKRHLIDFLGP